MLELNITCCEVTYPDHMAEFGEKGRQCTGIVILQAEAITKSLAVLSQQLANR